MCYIGEPVRTVLIDPIEAPAPLPSVAAEPELEPMYVPVEPVEVPELVPVRR